MASEFSPSTEVLYFRPRAHARWRPPRKYLLWPAWVYRVVAPMPRPRRLNVLEKAMIGLARAGIRRAEKPMAGSTRTRMSRAFWTARTISRARWLVSRRRASVKASAGQLGGFQFDDLQLFAVLDYIQNGSTQACILF